MRQIANGKRNSTLHGCAFAWLNHTGVSNGRNDGGRFGTNLLPCRRSPTDRPTDALRGVCGDGASGVNGSRKGQKPSFVWTRRLLACGSVPACARLVRPPSSARFAKGRRRQTKRVLHAARDSLRICASHLLHCGQTACTSRGGADFRHHVTQWLHRQTAPCQRHARGVHRTLRPLSAHGREAYCSRALAKLLSDIDFDAVCQQ